MKKLTHIIGLSLLAFTPTSQDLEASLLPDISHPAVVSYSNDSMEVFVRGQNNKLVQRSWNGSNWSGWKNHGGTMASAASVVSSSSSLIDVFYIGPDKKIKNRKIIRKRAGRVVDLGGTVTSSPSVIKSSIDQVHLFVRGINGKLVQRVRTGSKWSGWVNLGGTLTSAPNAVALKNGVIKVFYRGLKNGLYRRTFTGKIWLNEAKIPGFLSSAPSSLVDNEGIIHIFAKDKNGGIIFKKSNSTNWVSIGGTGVTAAPAVTIGTTNRIEVFVRDRADHLVQKTKLIRWGGWKNLGGDLRGKLKAKLRIMTHNVYGVFGADCDNRGIVLGSHIGNTKTPYDIVGVQEYYDSPFTCDIDNFGHSIKRSGRYRNGNNVRRFRPKASLQPNGGVGVYTLHAITQFKSWQWSNDNQGTLEGAEGFIFSRIKLNNKNISLDVYTVHLNSGRKNVARRRKQLKQLASKIKLFSATSGNPVIVMGDFNIGGSPTFRGNDGHEDINNILKRPHDLWTEVRPITNGFSFDCETNLTAQDQDRGCTSRMRIDYIYSITDPSLTNSPYLIKIGRQSDVDLLKLKTITGFHVSDHFGLFANIEIRDK
ncbi:endonuclease/exonuclease/phosphatase family protein [Bacteriovoracaceae bacterium]|nr:endonuclease/exonuclease/phosphatase family protein [Bacteriovoracaceae bacterium]